MVVRWLTFLIWALVSIPVSAAQVPDCSKLKDKSVTEGQSLDEIEKRFGDCLFSSDIFPGNSGIDPAIMSRWSVASATLQLQQRNYGALDEKGEPIDTAIREFQAERGEPVTGKLTLRQMFALGKSDKVMPANIWISGGTSSFGNDGDKPDVYLSGDFLMISGSWWLDGPDRIMAPLNKHEYDCNLRELVCHHAEMSIYPFSDGDELTASLNMDTLKIARVELPIVEIVPFDQPCRRPVITVNVTRKEVFEVTTQVANCPLMPDLAAPRVARMRSPEIQSKQYREEAEAAQLQAGSKRWKQFLDGVTAEGKKASKPN